MCWGLPSVCGTMRLMDGLQADCILTYLFVEDTDVPWRMEYSVTASFLVFSHHSFVYDK